MGNITKKYKYLTVIVEICNNLFNLYYRRLDRMVKATGADKIEPILAYSNLKKITTDIILPSFVGGLASGLIGPFVDSGHEMLLISLASFFVGFITLLLIFSFEKFVKEIYLKKLPFFAILLISTIVDVLIIFIVMLFIFSEMGLSSDNSSVLEMIGRFDFQIGLLIFAILFLLIQFILLLEKLIGKGVLFRILIGRYHVPVESERFLMFLDMTSSTTIAEKLGHVKFLSLLNDFFYDLSIAVESTHGEIYKYVGDEAIIVWTKKKGCKNFACLKCYFAIQAQIQKRSEWYLNRYELVPSFKAGLHFGTVAIGEMGNYRKEIAFIGDTVNTAARIEHACSQLKKSFLVSGDVTDVLGVSENLTYEYIGKTQLRGRNESTRLFFVDMN